MKQINGEISEIHNSLNEVRITLPKKEEWQMAYRFIYRQIMQIIDFVNVSEKFEEIKKIHFACTSKKVKDAGKEILKQIIGTIYVNQELSKINFEE